MTNDCELIETVVNDGITTFVFYENDKIKKLIGSYYSLKGKVEPMAYGQAIRTLKSVIHASKSNSKSDNKYERHIQCSTTI